MLKSSLGSHFVGFAMPLLKFFWLQHYKEVYERLEFVHKKVFPDAHRRRWKQADWTDETDQMILILQSIIHNKAVVRLIIWAATWQNQQTECAPSLIWVFAVRSVGS